MCIGHLYFFFKENLFLFIFGCDGSLLLGGGYSLVAVLGLLIAVASRCRAQVLRRSGCSGRGT